jgi:hypothetical protein
MNGFDGYFVAFLAGMVVMAILILMFQPAEYRR